MNSSDEYQKLLLESKIIMENQPEIGLKKELFNNFGSIFYFFILLIYGFLKKKSR